MKSICGRGERTCGTAIERPRGVAPRGTSILLAVLVLLLCAALGGCGNGERSPEYVEPKDADAAIVVHPIWGEQFNLFLDGQFLSKISWTQPYHVAPGSHMLGASELSEVWGEGKISYLDFSIQPGQTLHIAIRSKRQQDFDWGDDEWETTGSPYPEIRIFKP